MSESRTTFARLVDGVIERIDALDLYLMIPGLCAFIRKHNRAQDTWNSVLRGEASDGANCAGISG